MIIDIVINGLIVLLGVLFLLAAIWLLNQKRIWFVTLKQNRIKLISVNGRYRDYIHNTPGFVKNTDTGELVEDNDKLPMSQREEPLSGWKKWVFDELGLYFIGFSPFKKVMTFDVTLERLATDAATKGKLAEKFVHAGVRTEDELRHMFLRPFLIMNAETKMQFSINMLFEGKFYVRDPRKFVIDLDFKPFPVLQATFNDHVTGIISGMTWDRIRQDSAESLFFPAAQSKEDPKSSEGVNKDKRTLNEKLLIALGVECTGLFKEDPEVSERDLAIYEALKENEKKALLGKANQTEATYRKQVTILDAEAKKEARELEGQGEGSYITTVAEAKATGFESLIGAYRKAGLPAQAVSDRVNTEIKYDNLKNLRTLVDGNGRSRVGININDEQPPSAQTPATTQEVTTGSNDVSVKPTENTKEQVASEPPAPRKPYIKKKRRN